ncbi:MAG TPA: hypothetical protein VFR68_06425 [Candidatus Dormibacteraeota bacterium]|nr:hypothetical protein [Candidatus Dormibacteraeota bacterium]
MSIAGAYRSAVRHGHRVERRRRRRTARAMARWWAGMAGWCVAFLLLGWLMVAGFYDLLVHA